MGEEHISKEKMIENLKDAGCSEELICKCIQLEESRQECAMLCLLKKHRSEILEDIHEGQRKLDCLDYLVYKMRGK